MPFKNPHPLYSTWSGMRARCRNPNFRQWNNYGGRGITICERWDDFSKFAEDMGERPEGCSLDRIDNDKGYSPENCRWADRKQQQKNRSNALFVTIEGETFRLMDLAKSSGVDRATLMDRVKRGLPYAQVISREKLLDTTGLALGGKANGKRQKAKTHCPKGHPYSGTNVILSKEGYRRCRTCWNIKEANRRKRIKQEKEAQ